MKYNCCNKVFLINDKAWTTFIFLLWRVVGWAFLYRIDQSWLHQNVSGGVAHTLGKFYCNTKPKRIWIPVLWYYDTALWYFQLVLFKEIYIYILNGINSKLFNNLKNISYWGLLCSCYVAARVVWTNFCYEFGGEIYLQMEGGPIGLGSPWQPAG